MLYVMFEPADFRIHQRGTLYRLCYIEAYKQLSWLQSANNWALQVRWCPHNPDLLATAFSHDMIGIHPIQSSLDLQTQVATPRADGADVLMTLALHATRKRRSPSSNRPTFGSIDWFRHHLITAVGLSALRIYRPRRARIVAASFIGAWL